eukprot:TRINITY_DN129_c0_g1_i1.p2 TRINITY_DN129_c0_g1~~TRINITY_DN129_c0_g1_i1.p2  ORF type:complete len:144 (-),score=43.11 TRINITY_DN129_c0_g1_i1:34-465(-)
MSLPEETIHEYKEGFRLFDKKSSGAILKEDLGSVMRSLGLNPTNAELAQYQQESEGDIGFDEFLGMMTRQMQKEDTEENIKASFKIFDKNNTNEVSVQELKHVLLTIGEKLSEDDFDEMIKEAEIDKNGMINCTDFVKMLMSK